MADHPFTKTLKSAIPTVRLADDIVLRWDVEVVYTSTENGWKTVYSDTEEVGYLNKKADEFTKQEVIDVVSVNQAIFNAHWEAHNLPPTEDRDTDFDINSLA